MRVLYTSKKFGAASLAVIAQANAICAEYDAQGYELTLRQLYYQFVARGLIANRQSEYKRLGSIINDARLAGMLDWDYIVDRTRNVEIPASWENPAQIIEQSAKAYAIDRWEGQPYRVEVWVEKEALAGVVERATRTHRVPWFSCRGYTSQSELWGAAQRLKGYLEAGQIPVIIHLGDHDPSGIDMTRDIYDRLRVFMHQDWANEHMADEDEEGEGVTYSYGEIKDHIKDHIAETSGVEATRGQVPVLVNRIALNMAQVDLYDPPPNPAKLTDSRAAGYLLEFGGDSWELDALEPRVLDELIRDTIESYLDEDVYDATIERENAERATLRSMVDSLSSGDEEE